MEDFGQQFGFAGVERVTSAVAAPAGKYCIIVPQGTTPCVIATLTPSPGFTATNYNGKTLTAPLYIPFTALTLTSGEADVYKTVNMMFAHPKL